MYSKIGCKSLKWRLNPKLLLQVPKYSPLCLIVVIVLMYRQTDAYLHGDVRHLLVRVAIFYIYIFFSIKLYANAKDIVNREKH